MGKGKRVDSERTDERTAGGRRHETNLLSGRSAWEWTGSGAVQWPWLVAGRSNRQSECLCVCGFELCRVAIGAAAAARGTGTDEQQQKRTWATFTATLKNNRNGRRKRRGHSKHRPNELTLNINNFDRVIGGRGCLRFEISSCHFWLQTVCEAQIDCLTEMQACRVQSFKKESKKIVGP